MVEQAQSNNVVVGVDGSPRSSDAVAYAFAHGPEAGLELIAGIEGLDGYHLKPAARADLLRRLGRDQEAAESYREALALPMNAADRRFLERRLREVV